MRPAARGPAPAPGSRSHLRGGPSSPCVSQGRGGRGPRLPPSTAARRRPWFLGAEKGLTRQGHVTRSSKVICDAQGHMERCPRLQCWVVQGRAQPGRAMSAATWAAPAAGLALLSSRGPCRTAPSRAPPALPWAGPHVGSPAGRNSGLRPAGPTRFRLHSRGSSGASCGAGG